MYHCAYLLKYEVISSLKGNAKLSTIVAFAFCAERALCSSIEEIHQGNRTHQMSKSLLANHSGEVGLCPPDSHGLKVPTHLILQTGEIACLLQADAWNTLCSSHKCNATDIPTCCKVPERLRLVKLFLHVVSAWTLLVQPLLFLQVSGSERELQLEQESTVPLSLFQWPPQNTSEAVLLPQVPSLISPIKIDKLRLAI